MEGRPLLRAARNFRRLVVAALSCLCLCANITGADLDLEAQCALSKSIDVLQSCKASTWQLESTNPRLATAALLQACINVAGAVAGAPARPLRVVGPDTEIFRILRDNITTQFGAITGVPISFVLMPALEYALQRQALLLDPRPPGPDHGYDALLATPTAFGDAAQVPGKILDLSDLALRDRQLDWLGVQEQFRSMVSYNGTIGALPLIPAPMLLYYHLGVFQRDNLSVPQTWEQMAELAERYHGRDGMIGACLMAAGCRSESFVLRLIFGSYVQTHGHEQGMFWDSETLAPLVNTPAMEQALKVFRRLRAVGPNVSVPLTCLRREYVQGRCLLNVQAGTDFKIGQLAYKTMQGRMGMALLPGSTRVLDRRTNTMVTCTKATCPLAQGYTTEDGVSVPVNRPIGSSTNIVLFNGLSPPQYAFFAYNLFSWMASPKVIGIHGLLPRSGEVLPIRTDDLSDATLPVWMAAGYDEGDTRRFLQVYRDMAASRNANADLKIRLTTNVTAALLDAAVLYNNISLDVDVRVVMGAMEATLNAIVAAEGGTAAFAAQYRRSINWSPAVGDAMQGAGRGASGAGQASSHGRSRTVILAVAIPCGTVALLLCGVVLVVGRLRRDRAAGAGGRAACAPGPGILTTLVVTDIQDSTLLWEALDASTMDAALKLHHSVIRPLLLTHGGYESATEGDSFILAFSRPSAALLFALDVQQALLAAPWPTKLLRHAPLPGVAPPDDPAAEVVLLHRPPARTPRAPGTTRLAKPSTLRPARLSKQPQRQPQPQQQFEQQQQQQQQQQLHAALMSQQGNQQQQQQQATPLVASEFSVGLATLVSMFQSTQPELGDSGAGPDSSSAAGAYLPLPQRTDQAMPVMRHLPTQLPRAATAIRSATRGSQSNDGSVEIEACLGSSSGPARSHLHRAVATSLERHIPRSTGPWQTAWPPTRGHGQMAGGVGSPPTAAGAAEAGWSLAGGEAILPAAPPAPLPAFPASLALGSAAQLQPSAACTNARSNTLQAWASGGASTRALFRHLRESHSGTLAQVHEDASVCGAGGGAGGGAGVEGARGVPVRVAGAFGSVSDGASAGSPRASDLRQGATGGRLQPGSWLTRLRQQSGCWVRSGSGHRPRHMQSASEQRTSGDGRLCSITSTATTASSAAPHIAVSLAAEAAVPGGVELAPATGDLGTPMVLRGPPSASAGAPVLPLNVLGLAAAWGNPLQAVVSGQYRVQPALGSGLPPDRASSAPTDATLLPFRQSNDEVDSSFTATTLAIAAERATGCTTAEISGPGAIMHPSESGAPASGGGNVVRAVLGSPLPLPVAPGSAASAGAAVTVPGVRTGSTRKAQESRTVVFRGLRVRMGLHSGVASGTDIARNAASGRWHYSGAPLRLAKAVADTAHGGQVVLSEACREALCEEEREEGTAKGLSAALLLYMGRHRMVDKGDLREVHMHLWQAATRALLPRLALLRPLRTAGPEPPLLPALHAPTGSGAIARLSVVGAGALLAWNHVVASHALDLLYDVLLDELRTVGGRVLPYVVEGAVGLYTAAEGTSGGKKQRTGLDSGRPSWAGSWRDKTGLADGGDYLSMRNGHRSSSGGLAESATGMALDRGVDSGSGALLSEELRPPQPPPQQRAVVGQQARGSEEGWSARLVPSPSARASSGGSVTAGGSQGPVVQRKGLLSRARALGSMSRASARRPGEDGVSAGSGGGGGGGGGGRAGSMTVLFPSAEAAAMWLLRVMDLLPCLDWPLELLRHPLCEELQFEGRAVAGALDRDCSLLCSPMERRDPGRTPHSMQPHCAEGQQQQQEEVMSLHSGWTAPVVVAQASVAGSSPRVTGATAGGANSGVPASPRTAAAGSMTSPFQQPQQQHQLVQQAPESMLVADLCAEASLVSRPSGTTGYSAAGATGEAPVLFTGGSQDAAAAGATQGWAWPAPTTQAAASPPPAPATLTTAFAHAARSAATGTSHTGTHQMSPQGSWTPTAAPRTFVAVAMPGAARTASSPWPPASLQRPKPLQPVASEYVAAPGLGPAPAPLSAGSAWLRAAGAHEGMVFRGLRARGAAVWGELGGELPSSWSLQGQPTYRGKAWAALSKVASKAKQGEVATNRSTAALLPPHLAKLVVVRHQ